MSRRSDSSAEASSGYDGPSKTQVKREMHELQDLGAALLELPLPQYDALEMDPPLRAALDELRRLKAHSARKRQMQYVGKLLRHDDPAPFRRALDDFRASRLLSTRAQHEVEEWRERLLIGDEGLTAWIALHPANDTPQLRRLLRDARREDAAGRRNRACRELFKHLRSALQTTGPTQTEL